MACQKLHKAAWRKVSTVDYELGMWWPINVTVNKETWVLHSVSVLQLDLIKGKQQIIRGYYAQDPLHEGQSVCLIYVNLHSSVSRIIIISFTLMEDIWLELKITHSYYYLSMVELPVGGKGKFPHSPEAPGSHIPEC